MLEKELETAIALAREAGKTILEFYALEIIAEQKIGADNFTEPVTIADKTASRMIVEGLSEAFPHDGDFVRRRRRCNRKSRSAGNRVWMIDPIDGTWGFIKKDGDFGVQIGLTRERRGDFRRRFSAGSQHFYYAAKGAGAFLIAK